MNRAVLCNMQWCTWFYLYFVMNSILVLKHIMNLCGWGFKKTNRLPVKNEAVTSLQKCLISYYWNLKRNNKSYTQHQLFSFARLLPSDTAEYSSKPEYKKKTPTIIFKNEKMRGLFNHTSASIVGHHGSLVCWVIRVWVRIQVVTLVSLSKKLDYIIVSFHPGV